MAFKQRTEEEASLVPSDHSSGGGRVPDGEYDIVSSKTGLFTYPGRDVTVPAILVTYRDVESHDDYSQMYKAGDTDHLAPNSAEDGFVNPNGGPAKIFGDGAAHYWLQSIDKAGFEIKGSKTTQFEGLRVRLASKMIKLGQEKKDTPIPLIDKILGEVKATAKDMASRGIRPAGSKASSNGLDDVAVDLLKQVLGKNTLKIDNLGMKVWMAAGKTPHAEQRQAIKNLITVDWIKGRDEFETDGDEVAVRS